MDDGSAIGGASTCSGWGAKKRRERRRRGSCSIRVCGLHGGDRSEAQIEARRAGSSTWAALPAAWAGGSGTWRSRLPLGIPHTHRLTCSFQEEDGDDEQSRKEQSIFVRLLVAAVPSENRRPVSRAAASKRPKTADSSSSTTSPGRLLTLLLVRAQSRSLPQSIILILSPPLANHSSVCLSSTRFSPARPTPTRPPPKCRSILLLPDIPTTNPSRRPPSPRLPLRYAHARPPTPPSRRRQLPAACTTPARQSHTPLPYFTTAALPALFYAPPHSSPPSAAFSPFASPALALRPSHFSPTRRYSPPPLSLHPLHNLLACMLDPPA
jgi:hypothetical protein